ncbi:MAG: hypothetical protein A3K68_07980 [Euryarchaeota archaeon RBG_16_68_13]|nr:MAG: hypothetical protein A3K68_07980 [Euryarchaeota archaeon RBG_16_68_13]
MRGTQKLLDYWLYGLMKAAEELGQTDVFLREVEEEALRKFFAGEGCDFHPPQDLREAILGYTRFVSKLGIVEETDLVARNDAGAVSVEVGVECPYRRTCEMRHEADERVHCFRAVAFTEMLRQRLHTAVHWKLERFAVPCHIRITPSPLKAGTDGD